MPGTVLPYFTAAASGIFDAKGLDVEIVDSELGGPASVRAVAAGRYDCCFTSVNHFLTAKDEEPQLEARFVFMVARRSHMAAFVIEDRPAAHGRAVESFLDLGGATFVGQLDSEFAREYMALLSYLNLEPGEVLPLPYGEVMEALAAGKADVAADWLDLLPDFQDAARRFGARVIALPFFEAGVPSYGSGIVAGMDVIRSRPEALRRFAAAVREGLVATHRRPDLGVEAMLACFPDIDPERAIAQWKAGERLVFDDARNLAALGIMDTAGWEATIAYRSQASGTNDLSPEAMFVSLAHDPQKV